jgi:hypothetical protein
VDPKFDTFGDESVLWDSLGEPPPLASASARSRATSFPDKPAGIMGAAGRERRCAAAGVGPEDRRWRATISPSASPAAINGRCSLRDEFIESWVVISSEEYEFGSKGVTTTCGSASMELESAVEKDRIDLGLARLRPHRRRAKRAIPISAKMATAPPTMPMAIPAMFRFLGDRGGFVVVVPLAFIFCTATLRKGS